MHRTFFWLCAACTLAWLLSAAISRPRIEHADAPVDDHKAVTAVSVEGTQRQRVAGSKSQRVEESTEQSDVPTTIKPTEPVAAAASPTIQKPSQPASANAAVNQQQDHDEPEADPALPPDDEYAGPAYQSRIQLVRDALPKAPVNLLDQAPTNPLRSTDIDEKQPPLDPRMEKLKQHMRWTLAYYRKWPVHTSNRSPWEVMHAAIAFGCQSQLTRKGDDRRITALGHLCFNGVCEGDSLLRVVDNRIVPRRGPGLQGHDGQLLSILAQSKVKLDYPIRAYGRKFTVADLVEHEKREVTSGKELTFQLIGLIHYLRAAEEKWKNGEGEDWTIRRMLKEEINSPVRGAACGGTHRLMAISYAHKKRVKRGFPITGQYKRARKYVSDYHRYTFALQNSDGSFSTGWFRGRGSDRNTDLRMQTTGHIFEWLVFSLSDEQFRDKKMTAAAEYLTTLLSRNRHRNWKIGPLGHALHGLVMYEARMFGKTRSTPPQVAQPSRKPERTAMLPKKDSAAKPSKVDTPSPQDRGNSEAPAVAKP
jgi:hypothetical protein